jgi:hypothetical protein
VTTTAPAGWRLKKRLLVRSDYGACGVLRPSSAFTELASLRLADLVVADEPPGPDGSRLPCRPGVRLFEDV